MAADELPLDVLLSTIHVIATLCVGIAGSNNRLVQDHLTSGHEDILDILVDIVAAAETDDQLGFAGQVRIEAACALACLSLGNKTVSGNGLFCFVRTY